MLYSHTAFWIFVSSVCPTSSILFARMSTKCTHGVSCVYYLSVLYTVTVCTVPCCPHLHATTVQLPVSIMHSCIVCTRTHFYTEFFITVTLHITGKWSYFLFFFLGANTNMTVTPLHLRSPKSFLPSTSPVTAPAINMPSCDVITADNHNYQQK